MCNGFYLVGLTLLKSLSFLSFLQVVKKAETQSSFESFLSNKISSVISTLTLSASFCLFSVSLNVLLTQFLDSFSVTLGLFSFLQTLVNTSSPAQVFFDFWRGFGLPFFSLEALFLLDRSYSSGIYIILNVDFPLKSSRAKKALIEVSLKICGFLTIMTLF